MEMAVPNMAITGARADISVMPRRPPIRSSPLGEGSSPPHAPWLWGMMRCPADSTVVELGAPPRNGRNHLRLAFRLKSPPGARSEPFRSLAFSKRFPCLVEAPVFHRSVPRATGHRRAGPILWNHRRSGGWEARPVSGPLLPSPGQHPAREEVLDHLGRQHITAHVNFNALEEHGTSDGLRAERIETRAQTLLAAGFEEQFGAASGSGGPGEPRRAPSQPKTQQHSIGEAFRVLRRRRMAPTGKRRRKPETAKRPRKPGP